MKRILFTLTILLCLTVSGCTQTSQPSQTEQPVQTEQPTQTEAPSQTEPPPQESVQETLYVSMQSETDSPDWVSVLPAAQDAATTQLIVVDAVSMDESDATISMHERDASGNWKEILATPGYIGEKGLCLPEEHSEDVTSTPIGTYHFNKAFGIAPDPGCAISYYQVTDDTYWSGDKREGRHYNEMVDIKDVPDLDMTHSEHLIDCVYEYQYCLNISFNEEAIPGRGSAIFLHCQSRSVPYTAGCVAIPENMMKTVMQRVRPDCVIVIDTFENMNGSF